MLNHYHEKYASLPVKEINRRLLEKQNELKLIFKELDFKPKDKLINIAVLGCADKRLVAGHKHIFRKILQSRVRLTTFDITTSHLEGAENIIQHDCTLPIPYGNYDITYAHVLLKFIPMERQFDVLKNSYDILNNFGLAIHILDKQEYQSKQNILPNGLNAVLLDELEAKLTFQRIIFREIPLKFGLALVLIK